MTMQMLCAQFWARLGLAMLLFLSGIAPLHLADEVHALLPASKQHHAVLHVLDQHRDDPASCEVMQDDVSKPLSSTEHERHHEVDCADDSIFDLTLQADAVHVAPFHWHVTALEFVSATSFVLPKILVSDLHSRPPPAREILFSTPTPSLQSGRAPPVEA